MSFTYIIIGITVVISLLAFSNHRLIEELVFWPYRIWRNNEWHRLLTCGFIHADIGHLFFNMFALLGFGEFVEQAFGQVYGSKGVPLYLSMYIIAILGADIYDLFKQRDNYHYRALGASGAVSAVVFASILLNPFGGIYIFFIPIAIPAYIFGPIYLLYCAYMAKRGGDNIGHTAHFTGSIIGFVFPILFEPRLLLNFISMMSAKFH